MALQKSPQSLISLSLFIKRFLTEQGLLLGALATGKVLNAIAGVKLDVDLVSQARGAAVEAAGLDDDLAGHDVQLGVQAGAAVGAEEVVVGLARGAGDVALLGGSCVCVSDCDEKGP